MPEQEKMAPWRHKLHEIIFGTDTPAGKLFDLLLLAAIVLSITVVFLESMPVFHSGPNAKYWGKIFDVSEWVFTIFFTFEYIARIISLGKPMKYIFSFYGVIDLLSIVPTYAGIFIPQGEYLMVIRTLRLLRVFRVMKLARYVKESNTLLNALRASRAKITVFMMAVLMMVFIFGTLMYLIEGQVPDTKFDSIPRSIYWAIVTLTTVGYGDISPQTDLGQFLSAIIMIMGYAVIAVPTGIVSAEIASNSKRPEEVNTISCQQCGGEGHSGDADFCKHCGSELQPDFPFPKD
jgi:voltage-gated potassium channel